MLFISLTNANNEKIEINMSHIRYIKKANTFEELTYIHFDNNDMLYVKEPYEEVKEQIMHLGSLTINNA